MQVVAMATRAAVERHGDNKSRLARQLGSTSETVAKWCKGEIKRLDIGMMVRIFKEAGLSMDEAFGLVRTASPKLTDAEREEYEEELRRAKLTIDVLLGVKQPVLPVEAAPAVEEQVVTEPSQDFPPEEMTPEYESQADADDARSDMDDAISETLKKADKAAEPLREQRREKDKTG